MVLLLRQQHVQFLPVDAKKQPKSTFLSQLEEGLISTDRARNAILSKKQRNLLEDHKTQQEPARPHGKQLAVGKEGLSLQ